ncbi:MAG: hypothetical protein O7I42_22200, partial [Alphaproteobacteria bacterium]|nr:hypothetical protein [Alphaproteobacteria bacterium]
SVEKAKVEAAFAACLNCGNLTRSGCSMCAGTLAGVSGAGGAEAEPVPRQNWEPLGGEVIRRLLYEAKRIGGTLSA